jgi:hypothetical protein
VADRSIRDFQVPFAVAPVADAWASANGFALAEVEPDGSRHYVRGSGLLTGQMMCIVRQFNEHVRIEAFIHARLIARIGALFLIPEEKSIEPGGVVGVLPRKIGRDAVDELLAQLGQPPISTADTTAGPTISTAPAVGSAYQATAVRPPAISFLAIVEAVNAVVCLTVVRDYWWAFNWRAEYDDMNWAALDLLMVIGYLAIVGGSIAVAWRLWSMRRDAWMAAIQVSVGLIVMTVVSGLIWEFEMLGFVGMAIHAGILVYLNTAPVRALFGRPPLTTYPTSPARG